MTHYVTRDQTTKRIIKEEWISEGCYRSRVVAGVSLPSVINNNKKGVKSSEEYYDDAGHLTCIRRFLHGGSTRTEYYADKKLHNQFLRPARVTVNKDGIMLKSERYKRGKRSCYLGPAIVKQSRKENLMREECFLDGVKHSSHGPQLKVYRGGKLKGKQYVVNGEEIALQNIDVIFEPALLDDTLLRTCELPDVWEKESINTSCLLCYRPYGKKRVRNEDILDETKLAGVLVRCMKCLQTVHWRCLKGLGLNGKRCPGCQMMFAQKKELI